MRRAVSGFLLVMLAMTVAAHLAPRAFIFGYEPGSSLLAMALIVTVLPSIFVWFMLEMLQLIRPRRIFLGDRRASGWLIGWGCLTAFLAIIFAGLGMAWLDRTVHDAVIFSAATVLAALMTFPLLPRRRRGHCVYCNYDQRGASVRSEGHCAECGKPQPM